MASTRSLGSIGLVMVIVEAAQFGGLRAGGEGGQGDDLHGPAALVPSHGAGKLISVHPRHGHVGEDDAGMLLIDAFPGVADLDLDARRRPA